MNGDVIPSNLTEVSRRANRPGTLRRFTTPNRPVNANARGSAVLCIGRRARAGYWER